jgi:hypothetical protein
VEQTVVEQTVVEQTVINESSSSFIDSLREFVINRSKEVVEDIKEMCEIEVTGETVSILEYVLNNYPSDITNIHNQLNIILEDGKININDIPTVIQLVTSMYDLLLQKKRDFKDPNKIIHECVFILKIVFYVLVKSGKIQTPFKMTEKEFILSFNKIIDSCFLIIKRTSEIEDMQSCFAKLFTCFKKKSNA